MSYPFSFSGHMAVASMRGHLLCIMEAVLLLRVWLVYVVFTSLRAEDWLIFRSRELRSFMSTSIIA